MQRKALKQLNKVTQWTNEKVFSGDKTAYSEDFAEFEAEIEPLRMGVERLYATSGAFHEQLAKVRPSADPYPPSGSSKDRMNVSEALGLVMIDYGHAAGGTFGDALEQYGRARCKLAELQEEFSERLRDGFVANTEGALEGVNDYKSWRKKMDSRRLTLDSALARAKTSKKENPQLEQDVEVAQQRFEEAEEETHLRMQGIKKQEEEQFAALADLLEAERSYYASCKELLDDLHMSFPTSHEAAPSRPRAKSNASARSAGRTPTRSTFAARRGTDSDDESPPPSSRPRANSKAESRQASTTKTEGRQRADSKAEGRQRADSKTEGRQRSDSGASAGGKASNRRSIMQSIGSIGSFGMKSSMAAASSAGKAASKAGKSASKFSRSKYGNLSDEERVNLGSDEDEDYRNAPARESPARPASNRARSHSVMSVVSGPLLSPAETRRRALTSPPSPSGRFVKVLFDYEGREGDELSLRVGQVIEVTSEVSAEWLMGEFEGQTGMFPKAYTEEHIVDDRPTVPPRPTPTKRRSLPPAAWRQNLPASDIDSESETGVDMGGDENSAATSLTSALAPTPTAATTRARSGSGVRKAAPPPPPSRRATAGGRSRSSTVSKGTSHPSDEDSAHSGQRSGQLSPTRFTPGAGVAGASPFTSSAGARSPFAHSDDEDPVVGVNHPQPLGHGLAAMHLGRNGTGAASNALPCVVCGCSDFTQNVFKAEGVCSTCFHIHEQ